MLLAVLGAIFLKGFREAIGVAGFIVPASPGLNPLVLGLGFYGIATHPQSVPRLTEALSAN